MHKYTLTKDDVEFYNFTVKTPHGTLNIRRLLPYAIESDIGREIWYKCDDDNKPDPRRSWLK